MITCEMIKKHLPDEVIVKDVSNKQASSFICSFPEKYTIDGQEKYTSFVVTVSKFEILTVENLTELIDGRCKVAYKVGLEHHRKFAQQNKL